ncbi:hypothetical protein MDOR_02670 [Mycolicibacterium doricum]|uniref:Uncharacterized protein n=1 Tax=Mycolicibacterium doricum TaxID=126673 RepID=A0A7I7VRF8_9MYCO|nr:hypothetical protein MDOR_02670 [Mycolicibacterium doricum]
MSLPVMGKLQGEWPLPRGQNVPLRTLALLPGGKATPHHLKGWASATMEKRLAPRRSGDQDFGHSDGMVAGSSVGSDAVAQREAGAGVDGVGVVEGLAEFVDRGGVAGRG